jgi:hypothetical protein
MANTVQIIAVTTGTSVNKTCKSILGECCPLSRWMLLLQRIEEEGRASQVYSSTKMWGLGMGKEVVVSLSIFLGTMSLLVFESLYW